MHRTYTNLLSSSSRPLAPPPRPASANADLSLSAVDDDDDQVFCVVCEGECICGAVAAGNASRIAVLMDSTPSAYSPRVSPPVVGPSSSAKSMPSLKIKLPAGLLSKARASSSSTHTRSDRTLVNAKRLGRPAKPDSSARKLKSATKIKPAARLPARPPLAKKSAALKKKRKNRAAVPWECSDSEASDLDATMLDAFEDDPADFLPPAHLPTFVPASAVDSSAADSSESDSDSSLTSGFGSDASMLAEEEDFIVADQRHKERGRVKKDDPSPPVQNNWEIKPRMRSVSLEDDMDVDSGEETEADDDGDEDVQETDGVEDDRGSRRPVATTWSDGEQSELDAELFFANLGSGSSSSDDDEQNTPEDASTFPASPAVTGPAGLTFGPLLPLENASTWDAEAGFSGFDNLPTFVDANLAGLLEPEDESSASDIDEGPFVSFSDGCERDDEGEEGEEDGEWSDEDAGATTDEDLVDEIGLPTAQAMAIFKMPVAPASLAAVAPLATVSPYIPRVGHRRRPPYAPADILAGRGDPDMEGDSDEHDHDGLPTRRARSASWSTSRGGVRYPRMGRFDPSNARQAVIDGKTPDVPSPFAHRASSLRRSRASRSPLRSSLARSRGTSFSSTVGLAFDIPVVVDTPVPVATEHSLAPPIALDDVFHSSLLGADETEAEEPPSTSSSAWDTPITATPGAASDADMARWDFVPVSTFRHASSTHADILRTPGAAPYAVLKDSPFSQMHWPSRERARSASRPPDQFALERERTPTPTAEKSRQDLRRERRAARKAATLPPPPIPTHTSRKRPALHHTHHANGKTRSTGSLQRMGGSFGGSPAGGSPFGW